MTTTRFGRRAEWTMLIGLAAVLTAVPTVGCYPSPGGSQPRATTAAAPTPPSAEPVRITFYVKEMGERLHLL